MGRENYRKGKFSLGKNKNILTTDHFNNWIVKANLKVMSKWSWDFTNDHQLLQKYWNQYFCFFMMTNFP
jgi:hypothetical protein